MSKIKFIIGSLLGVIFFGISYKGALAVCPICTVAVGAGLGLSRWLGIDDAVSSIWIGGLILSLGFWTINWLETKKIKVKEKNLDIVVIAGIYAITLLPLIFTDVIGHPGNTIVGIDKIVFGTIIGSFVFLLGQWLDKKVREKKGKQLFQFQRVIFPVFCLTLVSLILYFYGGYLYKL